MRALLIGVLLIGCGDPSVVDGGTFYKTRRRVAAIASTPAERAAFLDARVPGSAVLNYRREHATGGG